MVNEPNMTTVRLLKSTVAFLETEGRFRESLASINERLLAELREYRQKDSSKIGDQNPLEEGTLTT